MVGMTAEQAAEWGKTLSFEKVWAAFMETDKKFVEIGEKQAKTDELIRGIGEKQTKNDEYSAKVDAKIDRLTENVNRLAEKVDRVTTNVGGLNLSMGELVETLFAPHLGEKFDAYQYNLRRTFGRVPIYDDTNRLRGEIDILLSNTTVCMPEGFKPKEW
ncbi:MAG: hypothetical protein LBR93_07705 [Treponema sp.]|jgi:predicted nuclease with TOPRIM domain|nr:hypothetical protein [Treponema sp.]